jgi:hypothetical protein
MVRSLINKLNLVLYNEFEMSQPCVVYLLNDTPLRTSYRSTQLITGAYTMYITPRKIKKIGGAVTFNELGSLILVLCCTDDTIRHRHPHHLILLSQLLRQLHHLANRLQLTHCLLLPTLKRCGNQPLMHQIQCPRFYCK